MKWIRCGIFIDMNINKIIRKISSVANIQSEIYWKYLNIFNEKESHETIKGRIRLVKILESLKNINSVLDYGCINGVNYQYIKSAFPKSKYYCHDISTINMYKCILKYGKENVNILKTPFTISVDLLILDQVTCYLSEEKLKELFKNVNANYIFIHDFFHQEAQKTIIVHDKYYSHNFQKYLPDYSLLKIEDDIRMRNESEIKWNNFLLFGLE